MSKLVHSDGDAIDIVAIDTELVAVTIQQGPHEICRLTFTGGELDVLIERLQRERKKVRS